MSRTRQPTGDFLTADEVAAIMHVSRMTVYRLVRADELLGVFVGRQLRIPLVGFDKYLKSIGTALPKELQR
jgi:excisionase family DNA binding protein